jgi:hypothetical protein
MFRDGFIVPECLALGLPFENCGIVGTVKRLIFLSKEAIVP